jgi:hypothetical protein
MTQTPLTISQLPDLGSVQGSDRLVLDRIGAAVTAGAFVVGQAYQIISAGNTSFTAIGAESNTVGAYFVATGAGTGTGTAGPINTGDAAVSALAALLGGDPAGTAAAAVAAHIAAADPHPGYTTPQEAAAAAPVQSVALSVPSGWSTSSTTTGGGVTLTLGLPSGFSLPSNSSQANWDTAYSMRGQWTGGATGLNAATGRASLELGSAALAAAGDFATSAQGVLAASAVQPPGLTSALAAYLTTANAASSYQPLSANLTALAANSAAYYLSRSNHSGTQALSTISGLGTGIATALAVNAGAAGAPVLFDGAGGTPSSLGLVNATGLPLATGVSGLLSIAHGGTGTATPGLVAGTHVTITGTWPNQTINATGGGNGGGGGGDDGTVTSVGLSLPSQFTVTGSPVTTAGTLTATLAAQSANLVWAGPTTGAAAAPAFRSLVASDIPTIPAGQVSGLGTLAAQNGTFSGTSSGTNTGDQDLSGLMVKANNLSDLVNAATARGNLGAAASGAIAGSGLTMAANRLLGRSTADTGTVEEISTSGGLVLVGGFLVPGEIVKLVVSDIGQTGITTGNFKSEARIDRAFVVVGITWNCHPTAMGSAATSDARPYIRTGAGTTSVGTKTNLLTTTNNVASLTASVHTIDVTSSISGGTYSGSAGDWLGVDLMSLGTGSSGHTLTFVLRYS